MKTDFPTASVGSSQAPTAAVEKSHSASNTEIQTLPSKADQASLDTSSRSGTACIQSRRKESCTTSMTLSVSTLLEHLMPSLLSAAVKSCVTASLSVFAISGALAQTPMSKEGSPGWYRMHLGTFEITALSDGTLD